MSNNTRRAKNYIRDCDLPRKKVNHDEETTASHSDQEITNHRLTKDGKLPTASDLEEAQLLIGAAGSIGEEQIVFMMDGPEVNQEEGAGGESEPSKPEQSEEEIKQELQTLLDSQLPPRDESDSDSKHLMGRREQVFEPEEEAEPSEPSKGFTENEIQAFMNNQIRKQHQQHVLGEQFDKVSSRSQQQPQQHLILVTQNGDKIILIQNPNEMDQEESEVSDMQPRFEITEEEEEEIQVRHRARQQMLLILLDKLREQHKERLPVTVTTPAVPHLQPIKLVPYTPRCKVEPPPTEGGETSGDSGTKQRPRSSKSGSRKRAAGPPRWLKPVNSYLNMAVKYMKRREEKVDDIARMFPAASNSFAQKCLNMKQDLFNIELIIERFQNTIGSDLEEVSAKFRTFLREFDLENCLDEVEAGDEVDEFDSNMFEVEVNEAKVKPKRTKKSVVSRDVAPNMQLITPANISITSESITDTDSAPTHTSNQEPDPFDFTQDPDSMIDIKPILPNSSTIKTGLVSKQELQQEKSSNHDQSRPVRSARLQSKRATKEPLILPPSKSRRVVRR